jgi:hypothetical protein
MKRMLIIIASVLLVLGVKCGASNGLPPPRRSFDAPLVGLAYLVFIDHLIAPNHASKKTVSTSGKPKPKPKPKPFVPSVSPVRKGLL